MLRDAAIGAVPCALLRVGGARECRVLCPNGFRLDPFPQIGRRGRFIAGGGGAEGFKMGTQ